MSRPDAGQEIDAPGPHLFVFLFLGSITHITEDLPLQAGTRDGDAATNRMPCSNRRSTLVFSTEVVILYADNQEQAWSVSSEKKRHDSHTLALSDSAVRYMMAHFFFSTS